MAHRNIVRTKHGNLGVLVDIRGRFAYVRFPNGNVMGYLAKDVQVVDIIR